MDHTWHILGAGALGSLFASHLARAGLPVQLLHRDRGERPPAEAMQLVEQGRCSRVQIERGRVGDGGRIHQLMICTKANQVEQALQDVLHRLDPGSEVILLHNGMGILDTARRMLPGCQLYCGVTTEGAYREAGDRLVYAGRGGTELGQQGRTEPPTWFSDLAAALPDLQWEADIECSLWRKLLLNCAINPLTAIHHCRNGELPELHAGALQDLCEELSVLAGALGQSRAAYGLYTRAVRVCQTTAANRSSMLSDIDAGRETEIEYITGFICRQAEAAGLAHPLNSDMLRQVRRLQSRRTH